MCIAGAKEVGLDENKLNIILDGPESLDNFFYWRLILNSQPNPNMPFCSPSKTASRESYIRSVSNHHARLINHKNFGKEKPKGDQALLKKSKFKFKLSF